ncbi:AI-2E family transporter [Elioraea rosea]|uniref:AI-2E family transporter n=1 Tax=Elioraea rosea TaxID=2492390 RepID=UPI00194DE59B|nr:AI-2E family transporter [Elioraea rosea]
MSTSRGMTAMVATVTAILVIAALALARPVLAPVACALFLIAVVWPLQKALQARMTPVLAVLVTVFATLVAVGMLASMVVWGFNRVAFWLIANGARLQEIFVQQTAWLDDHGIGAAALLAEHFDIRWMVRAAQQLTGYVQGFVSFTIITLVFTLLGLLEVEAVAERLARLGQRGASAVGTSRDIARKLQVYMAVRTVMSLLTGFGIWAFARVTGLQLAEEWGVIAFALNYIPFIGPLVATVFPTLFAGLQFGEWQMAITVFLGMNLIQFVLGSYLEPRMTGRVLSVSPFAVLFAVFFGALIWGVAGAFLGTPILIAILSVCERSEGARWVAVLLSGGTGRLAQNEPTSEPITTTATSAITGPTITDITRSP